MGEGKVWSYNASLTFYWLTSLSFHVNRSSHSWDTTFSKFDLENPRSRSLKRWTLKVTTWVQHSIDSHPFRSMSIGHVIHKIRLFQNLTLKIQGQGHGWEESHNMGPAFYRLTSLSSHVNRPSHSWDTTFQNLTLKIQGQGHGWGHSWKSQSGCNILSTHPFIPCQSDIPFLRYSIFKIWPWKYKVKVIGEVDIESHNMGPTFYRLTSF